MTQPTPTSDPNNTLVIGVVPFLNALPLTFGLDDRPDVTLHRDPPAKLAAALDAGRLDAALIPSIDYQHSTEVFSVLPVAAITSAGPVLTVRVLSRGPLEQITSIAADPHSHTSVALVQIIWRLRYHRRLKITPLDAAPGNYDSVLLIGDKVLAAMPDWPHQLDLGQAWDELTNLPFVYAFWAVRDPAKLDTLTTILEDAFCQGISHIDQIVQNHAQHHGFEPDLARRYLTQHIRYDFGLRQMQGVNRFYQLAHQFGLTPAHRELSLPAQKPCDYSMPNP